MPHRTGLTHKGGGPPACAPPLRNPGYNNFPTKAPRRLNLEFDVRVGGSALRRAQELPASADPAALGTAAFHIRPEACSGCGACRKHCPVQAIALVAGTPTWIHPACQMCLRCINSCPGMAIEYGDLTQGRARYVFQPP